MHQNAKKATMYIVESGHSIKMSLYTPQSLEVYATVQYSHHFFLIISHSVVWDLKYLRFLMNISPGGPLDQLELVN